MTIGIVGHEAAKFTPATEALARAVIRSIILRARAAVRSIDLIDDMARLKVVSGKCHLGGIDIWAIEEAKKLGVAVQEFPPKTLKWEGGFKQRNVQIAQASDVVHCVVVRTLPTNYAGMRFAGCYHCHKDTHVKSGGCWTALLAKRLGKEAVWDEI